MLLFLSREGGCIFSQIIRANLIPNQKAENKFDILKKTVSGDF
jgi:hypothetical protein